MLQVFGHLYEMLSLMCTGDFPGYQVKEKSCKATHAVQRLNKKFTLHSCRCSLMARGILHMSGKIGGAISSGQTQMIAKALGIAQRASHKVVRPCASPTAINKWRTTPPALDKSALGFPHLLGQRQDGKTPGAGW